MKKASIFILSFLTLSLPLFAQNNTKNDTVTKDEGYRFTIVKEIPITSVKDQNRAGTCWCYSGIGLLEAELLRMGKGEYDFSEMYIAHKTYDDRARAAIRMHGDVSFSQGGSFYDVIYGMSHYGLVPDSEMPAGAAYGDTLSDHTELSVITEAMVNGIVKSKLRKLQSKDQEMLWEKAVKSRTRHLSRCMSKKLHLQRQNLHTYGVLPIDRIERRRLCIADFLHTPPILRKIFT